MCFRAYKYNKPLGFLDVKHHVYLLAYPPFTQGCVKVEVAVLGSLSRIRLMVYVDGKQHRISLPPPHPPSASFACHGYLSYIKGH